MYHSKVQQRNATGGALLKFKCPCRPWEESSCRQFDIRGESQIDHAGAHECCEQNCVHQMDWLRKINKLCEIYEALLSCGEPLPFFFFLILIFLCIVESCQVLETPERYLIVMEKVEGTPCDGTDVRVSVLWLKHGTNPMYFKILRSWHFEAILSNQALSPLLVPFPCAHGSWRQRSL